PATKRGLLHDRAFMVIDENGTMMTQREHPQMCLIDLYQHGLQITLGDSYGSRETFLLGCNDSAEMTVKVWDDSVRAFDQGDEIARWLSVRLGRCRLVRMPQDEIRNTRRGEGQVGFADGYPILGISEASLDDLNARMKTSSVSMDRFRPNIVFIGCARFEEDTWRRIRIGDVELVGETLCARCEIPTTNQKTAERGKEPNTTLATFRRAKHIVAPAWKLPYPSKVYFGRNFNIASTGRVEVGMEIEVIERD
ncbi:MAG TPA: MOSC N-terminal beta barrel domain-containing protein, partial [Terriglobia bacterium]|nr:MOSC N-terminal beta barrel domain-containing protein [Terriglobia bacterium]